MVAAARYRSKVLQQPLVTWPKGRNASGDDSDVDFETIEGKWRWLGLIESNTYLRQYQFVIPPSEGLSVEWTTMPGPEIHTCLVMRQRCTVQYGADDTAYSSPRLTLVASNATRVELLTTRLDPSCSISLLWFETSTGPSTRSGWDN